MNEREELALPEVSAADVDRWDKEWMAYFSTEDREPHLAQSSRLTRLADLNGRSAAEVFATVFTRLPSGKTNASLSIYVKGDDLIGKSVLEIGCGCGFLGKQLGLVCKSYIGMDYSEVALAIARGNSPANCLYLHLTQKSEIERLAGSMDTMVGRHFFIHQNYTNATWVLRLGRQLLRPGGLISADFYLPNRKIPQGILHPAKSGLDPNYASCAFVFEEQEIATLANDCGLRVEEMVQDFEHQRRFAILRKPL